MKVYQVIFECHRTEEVVDEISYYRANSLQDVYEQVKHEGIGYDKELTMIRQITVSCGQIDTDVMQAREGE